MIAQMSRAEKTVEDFLNHHRYEPSEREGWYSAYEIYEGIIGDLGQGVRSYKILLALSAMQESNPPKIEDTWMLANEEGNPIIHEQHEHPDQPEGARRYYRVLQASVEYIAPE